MPNKLYLKGKECLGKDMSRTQNELGCVEAVREVFRLAIGQELGGELSTIKLYNSLLSDNRFQRVVESKLGDIIISPTNGRNIGHTGIISDNGRVMSNNSANSLWDEHLTFGEWLKKYKKLPTVLFRYQEPVIIKEDIKQKKISIYQQMLAIYQQIISQLLIKKLGNMNNSKLFRINVKDLLKGLLVACFSAVFLKLATALNIPGFSFSSYNWAGLLQVAIASGVGYISKQFFTDSSGTPLGGADK